MRRHCFVANITSPLQSPSLSSLTLGHPSSPLLIHEHPTHCTEHTLTPMDPPLINESSFSIANPSSYSLAGIWPLTGEPTISSSSGTLGDTPEFEQGGSCGRKRKDSTSSHIPSNSRSKRGKMNDNSAPTKSNKGEQQISKNLDPHKDYIHVRARRGQATDSHSLAERARREKISERMKILQDIVPGCNKIIGKALVLDEIINYIQSLQQQVEFLSMKLEEVNSRMMNDTTINAFPAKDLFDAAAMMLLPRGYAEGSWNEWLHVQIGNSFER